MHTHRVRFGVSSLRAMKPFKDTELGSTAYGGRFTPGSERQRAMLQGSLGALDEGRKVKILWLYFVLRCIELRLTHRCHCVAVY